MSIKKASLNDVEIVKEITYETINKIYPHYYPAGAVKFFIDHHDIDTIKNDIENGQVFIYYEGDDPVGTVSIMKNEIKRLFVLPDHQGKGYGGILLDYAEKCVGENYDHSRIDVSLSAKNIYLKRKYYFKEYHVLSTDNNDFLCYDVMGKVIRDN